MTKIKVVVGFLFWILFMTCFSFGLNASVSKETEESIKGKTTVICYLNGDNNLSQDVEKTLELMEEAMWDTKDLNVLILFDGAKETEKRYGRGSSGTKIFKLKTGKVLNRFESIVLVDLGEEDLGNAKTLESFVRFCRLNYPAERYYFLAFGHGKGIINTEDISSIVDKKVSSSLFVDETSGNAMTQSSFREAIKRGMNGAVFDLMIFQTCLNNMIETGFLWAGITKYVLASQGNISLVKKTAKTTEARGIKFDEFIKLLARNQKETVFSQSEKMIESYIQQYKPVDRESPKYRPWYYYGTIALVDASQFKPLAEQITELSDYLLSQSYKKHSFAWQYAQYKSQKFPSFYNLVYYDAVDFFENFASKSEDKKVKEYCQRIVKTIQTKVVLQKASTDNFRSCGVSLYASYYELPANIFWSHLASYFKTSFAEATGWSKVIGRLTK